MISNTASNRSTHTASINYAVLFRIVVIGGLLLSNPLLTQASLPECPSSKSGCGIYSDSGGQPTCRFDDCNMTYSTTAFSLCANGTSCCAGSAICAVTPTPPPAAATPTTDPANPMAEPFSAPRREFFDMVDPLLVGGGETIRDEAESAYASNLRSPGGVVSRALQFIFPLAGLILFLMLVWGGFEMLIGAPTKKSMESGRNRVTAAIVGFLLLFSSYWIWQIIEIVFGVKIL